jgi:hypothetical protein
MDRDLVEAARQQRQETTDAGAGELRMILLVTVGVLLALAVWFWLLPAILGRL